MSKAANGRVRPSVLKNPSRVQCFICLDAEVCDWIRDSLIETRKGGYPRPAASTVHRLTIDAFGAERMPQHENSTRSHLRRHEEVWYEWRAKEVESLP